jgi:hypothetical protein
MPTSLAKRTDNLLGAAVLLLIVALPVMFLTTPPMIDVLGHIGRYELQTGLDGQPWLRQFYAFRWQVIGNLGADLLVQAMHPIISALAAARVVIVMVPLMAATAILLLSLQIHGRITPFALLSLTLVYSLPFTWGFLNFSLSMALALLAFTLWLRIGDRSMRMALFVPISLAVWSCHTFGWAFMGILCTADSLAKASQRERSTVSIVLAPLRQCWPLLAPLLPMLLWRSSAAGAGIDGWFDLAEKAAWIIGTLRLSWEWTDKLCAGVLLLVVYAGWRSNRHAVDRTFALSAAIALAAFLLLPRQIFGSVFADMRLAPYVVMLGLLALRERHLPSRWMMLSALLFLGFRLALTAHVYHQRERELEAHLAALQAIPTQTRLATLIEMPCQTEWALPWFSHIGSVALTRKHVFANDQWANSSMNPLSVDFPAAGRFATDDRQLFFPARCGMQPTLSQSLQAMPVRAFTRVWVVGVAPAAIPHRNGLTTIWRGPDAAVFSVDDPLIVPAQRIRKLSKLQP